MFCSGSRPCCFITGASRGFGRSAAIALARQFSDSGTEGNFILVSRSGDGLKETKKRIVDVCVSAKVHVMVANLGEMSTLEDSIKAALCKVESSKVTHAFLLNNAGSLGDVSKCFKEVSQKVDALADYFNLNLNSPSFLTGKFLHYFKDACCTVVNVSSLMALQSFPYFSLYCTGKAARDMMCQVLAKEEPNVNVLSYAPGPLLTDMYEEIRTTCGNQEVVDMFNTSKEQSTALTSDQSAEKLVRILKENAFISGSHVDYFD